MAKRDKQIHAKRAYPPPVGIRTKPPRGPRKRNSATPGNAKGLIPTPIQKVMAKRSRSYRTKEYATWSGHFNGNRRAGR